MLEAAIFSVVTAIASGLHGGDHATKGVVVTLHALLSAFVCGLYSLAPVALFWIFLRRGDQARAEIDYMAGKANLSGVRKAYPLWLGYLIAPFIRFATKNPFLDLTTRRRQEVLGGFVLGLIVYAPLFIFGLIT